MKNKGKKTNQIANKKLLRQKNRKRVELKKEDTDKHEKHKQNTTKMETGKTVIW